MTKSNYFVIKNENNNGLIKIWTKDFPFEDEAIEQMRNISSMPFIFKHVSVMPDYHKGIGATVGSVIPTKGAIIPASVGVDIGCGMNAVRTSLTSNDLPENLKSIRLSIERAIPHGRTRGRDKGSWENPPNSVLSAWRNQLEPDFRIIADKYTHLEKANHIKHLCSLGTGNHFIEICLDENDRVWIILHSGSRGIGNAIGRHFISLAKKEMEKWHIHLPDNDLAYFPKGTKYFNDYWESLLWAQNFAKINRKLMMDRVLKTLRQKGDVPTFTIDKNAINCHHNYVSLENHFGQNVYITRKGAVRARRGDLCIIPGSMGDKSYICEGKGNPESFNSCSHGAGRKMSRRKAKETITLDDHIQATKGVECRKDEDVIDESPNAYKNIDEVMKSQEDLVNIIHTLKQIVCIKG